jgi:hypothetical protein
LSRCGGRLGGGRRGRRRGRRLPPPRQEAQRVEVPVVVADDAHAEVDVRRRRDCVLARADLADRVALRDRVAAAHRERAELQQGDRMAVRGRDRHAAAARRQRAGERDRAAYGRADGGADGRADVDAAVLAAGVRVGTERERTQDRPVDGPRPRGRRAGEGELEQDGDEDEAAHGRDLLLSFLTTMEVG